MALDQSALRPPRRAALGGRPRLHARRHAAGAAGPDHLEATDSIGATRYERADTRTTHRNGSRARLLSTKAGDVELAIPKLRHGSFFPALLEPRRRIDRALGR